MSGYNEEDLKQEFVSPDEFQPEESVDINRTSEQKARDLNSVVEENIDIEAKTEELRKAQDDAV